MRRVLVRVAVFGLIQIGIAVAIFSAALSQPRPGYLAALQDKIELLNKPDDRSRLLFVGGSSVAFGIQSGIFEQQLQQPAINLGLHASLGLDFYLRLVERHGRSGDVVVLLPEYALLLKRLEMTPEDVRRTLRNCPAAIPYLQGNPRSNKTFLDNMALSEFAYWTQKGSAKQKNNAKWKFQRLTRAGKQQPQRRRRKPVRSHESIYRRSSFNERGDMIAHHGLSHSESLNGMKECEFDERLVEPVIERLNRFADRCRKRNIRIYFSYPPIPDTLFQESEAAIRQLQTALDNSLSPDITILNAPDDSVFPESQFFDTATHLSQAGKTQRSQILARALVPAIVADRESRRAAGGDQRSGNTKPSNENRARQTSDADQYFATPSEYSVSQTKCRHI